LRHLIKTRPSINTHELPTHNLLKMHHPRISSQRIDLSNKIPFSNNPDRTPSRISDNNKPMAYTCHSLRRLQGGRFSRQADALLLHHISRIQTHSNTCFPT